MATILVTGGAGFIGSNFINLARQGKLYGFSDTNFLILDLLTYAGDKAKIANLKSDKKLTFVQGDILDFELVSKLVEESDGVIHFAAESHVDRSIGDPDIFLKTNIIGSHNLFKACVKYDKRILQVSTDEVYGSILTGYADEHFPLKPTSPYSASKSSADLLALSYFHTYHLDVVISRCGNNYGPGQYPEKLIPYFIKLLSSDLNVPLYGNGKNSRDWVHVDDHCSGLSLIYQKGRSGEIYNIGNVDHFTNVEIVNKILKIMNLEWSRVEYVKDRLGHDFRYAINSEKVKKELGWSNNKTFDEVLPNLIKLYSLK